MDCSVGWLVVQRGAEADTLTLMGVGDCSEDTGLADNVTCTEYHAGAGEGTGCAANFLVSLNFSSKNLGSPSELFFHFSGRLSGPIRGHCFDHNGS